MLVQIPYSASAAADRPFEHVPIREALQARGFARRDVAVFHWVVESFAATQRWGDAVTVQAPVLGGVLAGEIAKNVRRHVRRFG